MTKAQQVRTRRLQKYDATITLEAQKIFDWILDLMDANTEKSYYGSLDIFLYYGNDEIKVKCQKEAKYNLGDILLRYDRRNLFTTLCNLINNEDGFVARLNLNDCYYDSKAITLSILIEIE